MANKDKQDKIQNRVFILSQIEDFRNFIGKKLDELKVKLPDVFRVRVENQIEIENYSPVFKSMADKLDRLGRDFRKLADKDPVKVQTKDIKPIDLSAVVKSLGELKQSLGNLDKSVNNQTRKIEPTDFTEVLASLSLLVDQMAALQKLIREQKPPTVITNEREITFPTQFSLSEAKDLARLLGEIKTELVKLGQKETKDIVFPEVDNTELLQNLSQLHEAISGISVEIPSQLHIASMPPIPVPNPVTNININGLRGPVKSTEINAETTPTKLPGAALTNRRSIIIYNNGSQTVYLGGDDVSVTNGFPVAAGSYSPSIDLSDRVELYGIVTTSTANIRVLEASMDQIGQ